MTCYSTLKNEDQREAFNVLRRLIPENATVYTVCKRVSRSGMSRDIALYIVDDGQVFDVGGYVSRLYGTKHREYLGSFVQRVTGCGMDMGFHVVSSLAYMLYGNGYSIKHRWL